MHKLFSSLLQRVLFSFIFIYLSGHITLSSAAGLPEEFLLTQRWRTMFSTVSPLTNPAFINEENYLSLRGAYTSVLGEFTTFEVGATYPVGLFMAAGLSVYGQGVAQPYKRTLFEQGQYIETNEEISDNSFYFLGTYAYNIIGGLTAGINIGLSIKQFWDYTAIGACPDLGISYRLLRHPVIGTHSLGAAMNNLVYIPLSVPGDVESTLPRTARFSLVSHYLENQVESSFDFSLRDIGVSGSDFKPDSAGDIITSGEWNLDAKVGGWIIRIINIYGLLGLADGNLSYLGLAGGVNIPTINNGRDLQFLVQYLNLLEVEDKTPSSFLSIYLRADIGKHREEIYARKMARLANLQPNDLYIKALNLYIEKNFWDAFFIFSQLFVEYPDFFKNDWVSYFLGSCQEEMDMRLTAEEAYKKTKELYPRSAAVPAADLGLMRVYYRDANFGAVEAQFNELNKLGVPDSIKYHGYYYMGETEMKKENFSKAKQLFDLIPETHPDYVFAQHSAAVCNASTDNIEGAISNLENCIQTQVTTNAQKEIVNRSYVYIGYIFYEELTEQEGPLAKAVTAFRMVPKTSYYYVDALLGLAWTALKARQWGDCKAAGQELQSTSKNIVMQAEGGLLQAYAFMMEKNYNSAATILADASDDLNSYKAPSETELVSRQDESNRLRVKYTDVARKAYDLGTSRQSEIVLKQIDSLHAHQKDIKVKIDDFLNYVDGYEQATFFARNFESIREDVDYALARAEKLGGQIQETKVIEKFKKEDEKIDDELEKLKKQLEKEQNKAVKQKDTTEPEPVPEPEPLPEEDLEPEDLPDLPVDEEGWE